MWYRLRLLAVVVVALSSAVIPARGAAPEDGAVSPLLIISLDAFRWDYCELHPAETPNLRRLKAEGASARGLIPTFPSNTFPNHYTIVTGLRPAHHGILNNNFFDPQTGQFFSNTLPMAVRDSRWWGGEPIWSTAVKQGRKSACSFWPGSEAEISGVRPSYWKVFNSTEPFEKRLEEVVAWLQLQPESRPELVTFYLEETNAAGHRYGPDAPETVAAIKLLDTRVGALLERLAAVGVSPNVVVVSDHGMTRVATDRCFALDDYLDLNGVQIDFYGPVCGLRSTGDGSSAALFEKLKALPPCLKVLRVEDLPTRFHLTANLRLPPIWVLPEEGGWIGTRNSLEAWLKRTRGEHGYDPELVDMRGTLIVHGPAFRSDGAVIDPVENIHLYDLFCAILHLTPAANDGDDRLSKAFLK